MTTASKIINDDVLSIRKALARRNVKGLSSQFIQEKCTTFPNHSEGKSLTPEQRKQVVQAIIDESKQLSIPEKSSQTIDVKSEPEETVYSSKMNAETSITLSETTPQRNSESSSLTYSEKSEMATRLMEESGMAVNQGIINQIITSLDQSGVDDSEYHNSIRESISMLVNYIKEKENDEFFDLMEFTRSQLNSYFNQRNQHRREVSDFFGQIFREVNRQNMEEATNMKNSVARKIAEMRERDSQKRHPQR